jgi:hypothetical protein
VTFTAATDGLGDLGPHFVVEVHSPGLTASSPWRALDELVCDQTRLRCRVDQVGQGLAAMSPIPDHPIEPRTAASLAHLGLVARLIAPALAVAVRTGHVLDLNLASTWWQPVLAGAVPLSIPAPPVQFRNRWVADRIVAAVAERVIDGPVRELTTAVEALSVSPRVLWGNVASAVDGAAALLARLRPEWAARTCLVALALLRGPLLAGAGTVDAAGRFRRRSCCLLYRATPGKDGSVCQDCVLGGTEVGWPATP